MPDDLSTLLDSLSDAELEYVFARARVLSDAEAYRSAGIAKSTFYRWTEDERANLNEIAQQLRRRVRLRVQRILEDRAEDAARALVGGLDSGDERIRQKAAVEVLDRVVGKAPEEHHVTGSLAVLTGDDLAAARNEVETWERERFGRPTEDPGASSE